ncbi:hypothetical protein IC762_12110 [Bradyrhizobium genosp. L]|uniref:hypothetical protein n=1 Tax=Bradyrhizobium genosp. L TaxID=83637 RepID=UPI0018A2E070|nr:hypothetical protein [Bradyrhizobium genosp. L]QPF86988.1 hypothetical protein IC762_12110 [Bradyrhizobium genosp. L]
MNDISLYDRTIKPHLQAAQEYAYRAAREVQRMPARPAFFTMAEFELEAAEQEAVLLLETIRAAKSEVAAKPVETEAQ